MQAVFISALLAVGAATASAALTCEVANACDVMAGRGNCNPAFAMVDRFQLSLNEGNLELSDVVHNGVQVQSKAMVFQSKGDPDTGFFSGHVPPSLEQQAAMVFSLFRQNDMHIFVWSYHRATEYFPVGTVITGNCKGAL